MKIQMTHWPVKDLIGMLTALPDDTFICYADLKVEFLRPDTKLPDCMVQPIKPPEDDIPF